MGNDVLVTRATGDAACGGCLVSRREVRATKPPVDCRGLAALDPSHPVDDLGGPSYKRLQPVKWDQRSE